MAFPYRIVTAPGHAAAKQATALSGSGRTAILLGDPQNAAVVKEMFEAAPEGDEVPPEALEALQEELGGAADVFTKEAIEAFQRYDASRAPQREAREVDEILQVAQDLDVEDWFAARREFFEASAAVSPSLIDRLALDLEADAWDEDEDADVLDDGDDEQGDDAGASPGMPRELVAHLDPETGEPVKVVAICILPTDKNYEAPGLLRFGGWGESPYPAEHVAIWRRWAQRFGATIVAITGDSLEAKVADPPQSFEEAYELAQEFELYCPELIGELTTSLEDLAGQLVGQTHWFFWWDWDYGFEDEGSDEG
jgi:hypothetical protein